MYLATYAAAVLFRMLVEKGGEYTKRLSQELRILNFYLEKILKKYTNKIFEIRKIGCSMS